MPLKQTSTDGSKQDGSCGTMEKKRINVLVVLFSVLAVTAGAVAIAVSVGKNGEEEELAAPPTEDIVDACVALYKSESFEVRDGCVSTPAGAAKYRRLPVTNITAGAVCDCYVSTKTDTLTFGPKHCEALESVGGCLAVPDLSNEVVEYACESNDDWMLAIPRGTLECRGGKYFLTEGTVTDTSLATTGEAMLILVSAGEVAYMFKPKSLDADECVEDFFTCLGLGVVTSHGPPPCNNEYACRGVETFQDEVRGGNETFCDVSDVIAEGESVNLEAAYKALCDDEPDTRLLRSDW